MVSKTFVVGDQCRISYDDAWHSICRNDRMHYLSPTQYRIFRLFVCTSTPTTVGELLILAYCSQHELQEKTRLSRGLLIKHISNLNARIFSIGLEVCVFRTGYVLTCTST